MRTATEERPGAATETSLFPKTRWSLVLRLQGDCGTTSRRALADLCQSYWYPIYAFARSRGLAPHDAEDSTQALFERLIAREAFDGIAAEHGRLRAYLLASMKNLLAGQWRSSNTAKRGGAIQHVSIDREWAEGNLAERLSTEDDIATESLFDREWAYTVLAAVSKRLTDHYRAAGKLELYEAIKGCLEGDGNYGVGADLAKRLGMSREGVRSAVFKLRRRFREYVEEAVRDTCADETEVRDEIAQLCRVFAT